ncbi:hypothetical protein OHS18_20615 [Amycolatopsis sp. NBC_00355]|uniref:hypothetical protein n=1 Tax=Amycolatopsis sp. NBC_00355 TaxID=2975957 RepID=UPI002E2772A1
MVHDDDIRPPETIPIRTADVAAKGRLSRPPEDIHRLIVAEAAHGRGAGAIREAFFKKHHRQVPLEWVLYVLEEARKAAERRTH